jgi:SAM-dependent methyltransferase
VLSDDQLDRNIPARLKSDSWYPILPSLDRNIKGDRNVALLAELLLERCRAGGAVRVLVIGGRVLGQGMEQIISLSNHVEVVHTDVGLGPETQIICDAHDLPFESQSFDCVIAQAVFEHVLDPVRCVKEVHRILKIDGLVYAETPFMQQGHLGPYDFTRFTYLGHRNLFREFVQIEAGALCGPGMALAWAYRYFLCSFAVSRKLRRLISGFAHFTAFFLKYFDEWLIDKPGTYDAASAFYFMGRKSDEALPAASLLQLYRGMN